MRWWKIAGASRFSSLNDHVFKSESHARLMADFHQKPRILYQREHDRCPMRETRNAFVEPSCSGKPIRIWCFIDYYLARLLNGLAPELQVSILALSFLALLNLRNWLLCWPMFLTALGACWAARIHHWIGLFPGPHSTTRLSDAMLKDSRCIAFLFIEWPCFQK